MVSVIMPAFNAEKTIEASMLSVVNQTYKNIELILINDKSTDDTDAIVNDIIKQYPDKKINYIKKSINEGVAEARNTGFRAVQGEYIAFLDSDDLWHKEKIEKQLQSLKETAGYFSITSYEVIDSNSNKLNKLMSVGSKVDYFTQLKGSRIGCLTVLIDRKVVQEDIIMPSIGHEDYLTWQRILKKHGPATPLDECLAYYRVHNNTQSSNKIKAAKWQYSIYRKHLKLNVIQSLYFQMFYVINALFKYKRMQEVK